MTAFKHPEQHFMASDIVRDIVIGMSDGLTVPFAIAAGMSGAAVAAKIVVTAGLAEIAAGSISMGLGGYLAGRTDVEHYETERKREMRETEQVPEQETREVAGIKALRSGLQTTLIGGLAAGAAFAIARLIG